MLGATACCLVLAVAVLLDRPVTVEVPVPSTAKQATSISLRLESVVVKRSAPVLWNIFWNMPQATLQTPVTDEHFVGYVSLPANSALRDPKPANFNVPLPSPAVLAAHRLEAIRFTFVPMRKPPEGGVSIRTIRLE